MKKYWFFILFSFCLFCSGCSDATIEGKVINALTDDPLEVKLTATTQPGSPEETKKASFSVVSSKDGSFKIKGCIPNREYLISIADPDFVYTPVSVVSPDKNKSINIPAMNIMRKPPRFGIYLWNKKTANWQELDHNYVFKVNATAIKSNHPASSVLDLYLPMMMDKSMVTMSSLGEGENFKDTQTYSGQYSQIGILDKAHQLEASDILAFYGDYFNGYVWMGLYYYPEIDIYDRTGSYPGSFNFPEGYHAGMKNIRGTGQCCPRFLKVNREVFLRPVREMEVKKVGDMLICQMNAVKETYNVILPGRKLELNKSHDVNRHIAEGIPGIVFTMKP